MTLEASLDFLVRRDDLHVTRLRTSAPPAAVPDGDVLLRVDSFALTANNVTYAAMGDAMSYWSFFPSGDAEWGRVPVWGFGTVLESRCEGLAPGERFYGYFPMSTHLLVQPAKVRAAGFVDASAHRAPLHALYNQYTRNSADPLYDPAREALQLLLRPLFITSFVIDDYLADNAFFGARAVIVSSASSKTAFGLAWQLSQRRPDGPEVIGLTSPGNRAFVEGLRCYDRVVTYENVVTLPADAPVAYVDFAGDGRLRASVHRHFGDRVRHSSAVGVSHWDAGQREPEREMAALPGAKPTLFFAPAQIKKRSQEWGPAGFQERFAAAWHAFLAQVGHAGRPWMNVVAESGPAATERVFRELTEGRARPDHGRILSLHGG